jgi:hypothetical protein
MNMAEIKGTQDVGFEINSRLQFLNLEPGRENLPVTGISTNNFESLVHSLVPLIESVDTRDKGSIKVTFNSEPSWDTGVIAVSEDAKAGVALVARSATYMAAKLKLAGDEIPMEMTVQMRELEVNATTFLIKNPWSNDLNASLGMRPISVMKALRTDPNYLMSELKPAKSRYKLGASLAALSAGAIACELASPTPSAISAEMPTPAATRDLRESNTATPETPATPTYVVPPNSSETGVPVPGKIESVTSINPFDVAHKGIHADVVAGDVEKIVNKDFNTNTADTMTFLEVASKDGVSGMMGIFTDKSHASGDVLYTVWTVTKDGEFTYLGRTGETYGYAPIYREDQEGRIVWFVITPQQGKTPLFESTDGGKTITGFLPLGQDEWIESPDTTTVGGKLLAPVQSLPVEVMSIINQKGHIDEEKQIVFDTKGEAKFKKIDGSWVDANRTEYKGLPVYTVDEAKQIILEQGSMNAKDRVFDDKKAFLLMGGYDVFQGRNWLFTYKGIDEHNVGFYDNNRVKIDGKYMPSTLYTWILSDDSNKSWVMFKDTNGKMKVLTVSGLTYSNWKELLK